MAKENKTGEAENKEANKLLTILIALFIVIIWLSIFAVLVKLDVGGFGSGVLRPILKDVPIFNLCYSDHPTRDGRTVLTPDDSVILNQNLLCEATRSSKLPYCRPNKIF